MRTLFLKPDDWDLALDASGNIATATDVYQQAQDIASACRVFIGDLYYNAGAGIPYSEAILGGASYPLALYKANLEDAALSVAGVASAQALISLKNGRDVIGAIVFTNENGETGQINL